MGNAIGQPALRSAARSGSRDAAYELAKNVQPRSFRQFLKILYPVRQPTARQFDTACDGYDAWKCAR